MTKAKPTEEEINAARALLRRAAPAEDAPIEAMRDLVAMPEFATVDAAMIEAQRLNPANTALSYAISMFNQMKTTFTVA